MAQLTLQHTFNLAVEDHQAGRLHQAEQLYREILAQWPEHTGAMYHMGVMAHQVGRHEIAVDLIRRVIALDPNLPEAHNNLGLALKEKGQLEEAIAAYRQAIALNPNYTEAYNNLGVILRIRGRLDEAIFAYRQVMSLNPSCAEAYNNLGLALKDKGRLDEAIAAYRQGLQLKPHYAEAHSNLGNFYKDQGYDDLAEGHYRLAIYIKPELAAAYNNLGALLEQAGDFHGAEGCYRQGIERARNDAICHANLATLMGQDLPDEDMTALNGRLADPSIHITSQSYLHFAAGHVLNARECYQEAEEHMRMGNALCKADAERKGAGYNAAAHAQSVSRMIDTCSAEFFQRVKGMGLQTQRPVFIIGLPRSGTTLTEQILAGHSQVFGAGELPFGKADLLSVAGESAATQQESVREDIVFQKLGRIDRETIQNMGRRHLLQLDKLNSTAARVVDKMPENYQCLGLLAALFPQATFIHCRRDLRDVAISCFMTRLDSVSWANDLEHIASRIEQYRRLMQHWRTVLGKRWLDCDYEQTVADLEGTARSLIAWCGLEWEPACVNFHRVKRPIRTASLRQVRQPIFNRSVGRWKHYEKLLAPVLARLS